MTLQPRLRSVPTYPPMDWAQCSFSAVETSCLCIQSYDRNWAVLLSNWKRSFENRLVLREIFRLHHCKSNSFGNRSQASIFPLLSKINLDRSPPCVLWFYTISHVPGKFLYTADTLSYVPISNADHCDHDVKLLYRVISCLPASQDTCVFCKAQCTALNSWI